MSKFCVQFFLLVMFRPFLLILLFRFLFQLKSIVKKKKSILNLNCIKPSTIVVVSIRNYIGVKSISDFVASLLLFCNFTAFQLY